MRAEVKGAKSLMRKLDAIGGNSSKVASKTLYRAATDIMAESKQIVPVDQGTLQNSGTVLLPTENNGKISVTLGYGGFAGDYALRVHENPRAGKTDGITPSGGKRKTWAKGGTWKFLEIPFNNVAPKVPAMIALDLRREINDIAARGN